MGDSSSWVKSACMELILEPASFILDTASRASSPESGIQSGERSESAIIKSKFMSINYLAISTQPDIIRKTPSHLDRGMLSWKMNIAANIPKT